MRRRGRPKPPAETAASPSRRADPPASPSSLILALRADRAVQRSAAPGAEEIETGADGARPSETMEVAEPTPASTLMEELAPPTSAAATDERADGVLIVEDGSAPRAGQLTKSAFLRTLEENLEIRLSDTLAGSGYTAKSCPTISYWVTFGENLSASRLERALRLYARAESTQSAGEYLDRLVERVQVGVRHWRATGEVTGVPAQWESEAAQQEAAFNAKAADPSAASKPEPLAVQTALGEGTPLPRPARSAMEGRFGASFGDVRLHTDAKAGRLARGLGARAFTVGQQVAFAPGEYAPGTLRGDLLLAHELAHTLQQGRGNAAARSGSGAGNSGKGLERQANLAAATAFAPELEEAYGGTGALDEEALLREAENAPAGPSGGLRIQRCDSCGSNRTPMPQPTPAPWWEEAETNDGSVTLYCRPLSKYSKLLDLLRTVDVRVNRAEQEELKMSPRTKKKERYIRATASFTQWTPADVKTELQKILPASSGFLTDTMLSQIEKVVAAYRAKHPNTFSVLQGIEAAKAPKWPTTDANCIATMNKAVSDLYGPSSIKQMSELGTTVQGSIEAVEKKGLVSEKQTFAATYTGSTTRYQLLNGETDVALTGVGKWAVEKAAAQEDGVHAYLLSVANGFHSVTLLVMKGGGTVTLAWKDQIEGTGITQKSDSEVDQRIRQLLVSRYRYWIRDKYIEKYKPTKPKDEIGYDYIKGQLTDDQLNGLEDEVKANVNRDISLNTLAKLQPAKR